MDLSERKRVITALADYVVGLPERDADGALSSSHIGITPSGWADWDRDRKHRAILSLLASTSEDNYSRLIDWARLMGDELPGVSELAAGTEWTSGVSETPLGEHETDTGRAEGPIFVVHGHSDVLRHEVVRVLERATGREVVVLHEQPNQGQTILEKFESHAASSAYAVVLLTGDDHGAAKSDDAQRPRGRQNVVFELGFFFGKLGRRRVAVLLEPNVEKPSDIDGLVYISVDPAGAWKYALARDLDAAGISVDQSRIP